MRDISFLAHARLSALVGTSFASRPSLPFSSHQGLLQLEIGTVQHGFDAFE